MILLSLSPWPSPRLSSCISLRSKITSSWPKEDNSELQLAKSVSKQTVYLRCSGKAIETGKLNHSEERMMDSWRESRVWVSPLTFLSEERGGLERKHCPWQFTPVTQVGLGP